MTRSEEDPKWREYFRTVLEFPATRDRIDLRVPVGEEERAILARQSLHGAFAVITADNPYGRVASWAENQRRYEEMRAVLSVSSPNLVQVDGLSAGAAHRERGVAVAADIDEARALGRRFEQSAVFWCDGQRF